ACGRDAAGSAGVVARRLRYVDQLDRRARERIFLEGFGEARSTGLGHPERRIVHLEGLEDALRQKLTEAFSGGRLDDPAEDIGSETVLPSCPGLIEQRNL